jgi:hypothetical protein
VTAGFEATIPLSRGRGYGEGLDELAIAATPERACGSPRREMMVFRVDIMGTLGPSQKWVLALSGITKTTTVRSA